VKTIFAWLGLAPEAASDHTPLRAVVDALEQLPPDRAQHLARFAYLLGRVAHADRHVSADETRAMETLVREQGALAPDLAILVVSLAKSSNLLFGGTADFEVARDFAQTATYEEKLSLARCLFSVASVDASISMAEETEIHRTLQILRIEPPDLTTLRLQYKQWLPGMSSRE
jgi:uncharacterized tellurite resistance protein B-like protein